MPACYLREWAKTPIFSKKDPFVWIIDKNTKQKRRDKVKNILVSNDLYTIKIEGKKNYVIEETLASLEGNYARIFKEKINKHKPLNDEEHIILCTFTAVMM